MTAASQRDQGLGLKMIRDAKKHYKIGHYYVLDIPIEEVGRAHKVGAHSTPKRCKMVGRNDRFAIFKLPWGPNVCFKWHELGRYIRNEGLCG